MPIDTSLLATLLAHGRTVPEIAHRLGCTEEQVIHLMEDTPVILKAMQISARHMGVWCGEMENAVANHRDLSC